MATDVEAMIGAIAAVLGMRLKDIHSAGGGAYYFEDYGLSVYVVHLSGNEPSGSPQCVTITVDLVEMVPVHVFQQWSAARVLAERGNHPAVTREPGGGG